MTHDELLTKIDSVFYEDEGGMQLDLAGFNNQYRAIRAVVELCNFLDKKGHCCVPVKEVIQAIEKELK
jgi:hypothetical protein